MFSLIWVWINGWINYIEAGHLRRHRAHYDVIVMTPVRSKIFNWNLNNPSRNAIERNCYVQQFWSAILIRPRWVKCCYDDVIKWKHFPRYWYLCGEFTSHRWIPHTKASDADVFFDLRLNKPLSKQSWGWWFETPSRSLWRQCNVSANTHVALDSNQGFIYRTC